MPSTTYTSMIYNALASAIDSVVSSISSTNTYDEDAVNGRLQGEKLHDVLKSLSIDNNSIGFMNSNREFMKSLMNLNKRERDITLNASGVNATGESNTVKNEYVGDYEYVEGNNYYENFAKDVRSSQIAGDETTKYQSLSNSTYNYSGNHNDLYSTTTNLFPDDDNKGTFYGKWTTDNQNSLLYKTKKLFNDKKIKTIISRFHTDPSSIPSSLDNAKTKYGLSHGRNLLTKENETGYGYSGVNGYDNPYCRVWTHHHQYDRYYKTIRPFSYVDEYGNYNGTIGVEEFHGWNQFSDSNDGNAATRGKWGWKKDKNNGWQYSVLQDNGKVNITPKYKGGGSMNIHTKQCMFSIENLAWRGYDPYSFEQALSWEQRGPMGGRIMWFPPYGIEFSESTSAKWEESTFLGRGENVYTYSNTTRTGTLKFMMVVDHPSIIDYVTWTQENNSVTDTDILRFLAGCGDADGDGFRSKAKPTPLTDEYTQVSAESTSAALEEDTQPEPPDENPEDESPIEKQICFYVFYPNNYSGTYDNTWSEDAIDGRSIDSRSKVEVIPYLLAGKGAQKSSGSFGDGKNDTFINDIELTEDTKTESNMGNGYEMGNGGISTDIDEDTNYISGTSNYENPSSNGTSDFWPNVDKSKAYSTGNIKKWWYRVDGRYCYPQSSEEKKIHNYNQKLYYSSSYKDTSSSGGGLNKDIETVYNYFSDDIQKDDDGNYRLTENENSYVFTLAEIAYAMYGGFESDNPKQKNQILMEKASSNETERIAALKKILQSIDGDNVATIEAEGYASSQGYTTLNEKLALNRARSAAFWLKHMLDYHDITANASATTISGGSENATGDSNVTNAKIWRYARVILTINTTSKTTVATASNTGVTSDDTSDTSSEEATTLNSNRGGKTYLGYSPNGGKYTVSGTGNTYDVYVDKDGEKWYLNTNDGNFYSLAYASEEDDTPTARYDTTGSGKRDENRLRYDQEYHFFKVLEKTDPVVFDSLMDKLRYFDPAFHSMTPEGFNGRLTFLQQCMRQGNTVSASDGKFEKSANNLAFGRAPYCVLRLGDFYNQMIVIDSLQVNYDPLVWDLNVEGAGVQPLIANVAITFKFIGGGDMTGPVRRLQNAMSFNYYANARLYDNRADRIERKWSDKTNGAIEHDEILSVDDQYVGSGDSKKKSVYAQDKNKEDVSTFYTTQMYQ